MCRVEKAIAPRDTQTFSEPIELFRSLEALGVATFETRSQALG